MIAGLGGCQPMWWHQLPIVTSGSRVDRVGPGNREQVHGAVLGGAFRKALHIGGLIIRHLLSSDGGFLALKPLTGMTSMPIPREDIFFCF